MAVSRREFITRVGQAGGFSAAFLTMQTLGMLPAKAEMVAPIEAAPGSGKGVKVVILGGGIAGLVAAYEMRKLGYECTVLEARSRPGGRNWTVRGGDKITFTDGTVQTCTFNEGNYQNVGPARLPSVHRHILNYCKELGVQLEIEVNTSRSTLLENDKANGGKPVEQRQAINDTRGHVAELLTKSINAGALDAELSKEDHQRMLEFLAKYGPLDETGKYVGSDRAGYAVEPAAGSEAGTLRLPMNMHTLLDASFWDGLLFEEAFDMQATMFQPVGGMDRIPYAFAKSLGSIVKFDSPVTEIRKTAKGVRVGYTQGGAAKTIEAEFCFCAMPLSILKKIPNDFSAPYKKVIDECVYAHAYKVAWESRRFWEQDYNIYGGLEFVSEGPSPIWFPSARMFSERGVLVAGYTDERRSDFGKLTVAEKFDASRGSIEKLHPGHGKELEKPIYVGWGKIPYNEGSWIQSYGPGQDRAPGALAVPGQPKPKMTPKGDNPGYDVLLQPDGPIYFVGDHVSHWVGWQEGAAESSLRAIKMMGERVKSAKVAVAASSVVSA
ncbi:FAD-dependent oxidoreductase [Granulicella sp. WH15]|uniref:flavin monoamine oxidase family protein n=1 Tax=Granulicella sp. WH15 TaxID=2602070 RepID=UPI001366DA22|nr:FAD-dependent oxidoreductase [Granulicella sp. WH15]QHN04346.1 FAD-dependent oxidoreductase [Granulicella sp. WH15]